MLLIVTFIVLFFSVKNHQPVTELYFDEYDKLQVLVKESFDIPFTIGNFEENDINYTIRVYAENFEGSINKGIIFDDVFQEIIDKNNRKVLKKKVLLPKNFSNAKITVSIPEKGLEIHFWVENSDNFFEYDIGTASVACLNKTINVDAFESFKINVSANWADGWPNLIFFADGKLIENKTIDWLENKTTSFNYPLAKGDHFLDFIFWNDHYNNTISIGSQGTRDRNILISNMIIDNNSIPLAGQTIDLGTGLKSFDCQNTKSMRDGLYSPSALRLRVNVS